MLAALVCSFMPSARYAAVVSALHESNQLTMLLQPDACMAGQARANDEKWPDLPLAEHYPPSLETPARPAKTPFTVAESRQRDL